MGSSRGQATPAQCTRGRTNSDKVWQLWVCFTPADARNCSFYLKDFMVSCTAWLGVPSVCQQRKPPQSAEKYLRAYFTSKYRTQALLNILTKPEPSPLLTTWPVKHDWDSLPLPGTEKETKISAILPKINKIQEFLESVPLPNQPTVLSYLL